LAEGLEQEMIADEFSAIRHQWWNMVGPLNATYRPMGSGLFEVRTNPPLGVDRSCAVLPMKVMVPWLTDSST